ncbi:hypothetical protein GCM10027422_10910 [Hymenobacter arcticus]
MVEYLPAYLRLLQRALAELDELLRLYAPDQHTPDDWAARTLRQTQQLRQSLAERLAQPPAPLTAEDTSAVTVAIGHYLDGHWADYQQLPTPDPAKRAQLLGQHAALEAIVQEIAPIHNSLR